MRGVAARRIGRPKRAQAGAAAAALGGHWDGHGARKIAPRGERGGQRPTRSHARPRGRMAIFSRPAADLCPTFAGGCCARWSEKRPTGEAGCNDPSSDLCPTFAAWLVGVVSVGGLRPSRAPALAPENAPANPPKCPPRPARAGGSAAEPHPLGGCALAGVRVAALLPLTRHFGAPLTLRPGSVRPTAGAPRTGLRRRGARTGPEGGSIPPEGGIRLLRDAI